MNRSSALVRLFMSSSACFLLPWHWPIMECQRARLKSIINARSQDPLHRRPGRADLATSGAEHRVIKWTDIAHYVIFTAHGEPEAAFNEVETDAVSALDRVRCDSRDMPALSICGSLISHLRGRGGLLLS
ncbi:hypothetical protein MAPG_06139 [Magnaporthiopsis poae ATCC 64411]|uniref:Uncharacterized protein n=1 Tax=Magnaporthiopsis poae (strain ATCC 64411 / 73-15) TaxID=644358 RepID=A0A0C4E185_MAGP6|nr:hypothetical protein MAPG_06139 [Magnaporthiopsis poae ATCC 64411]